MILFLFHFSFMSTHENSYPSWAHNLREYFSLVGEALVGKNRLAADSRVSYTIIVKDQSFI